MRTIVTPRSKFTLILIAPLEATVLSLLHISLEFPFLYQLFYMLLQVPTIPLCNGHDPCENDNTCSYRGCGVKSAAASATSGNARP